ncbi:MAG: hypothetical protein J6Z23_06635, partial [Lachnospiraceae bacterium]|nr:hypothetical protein [Lachnospiraceae bacterium]
VMVYGGEVWAEASLDSGAAGIGGGAHEEFGAYGAGGSYIQYGGKVTAIGHTAATEIGAAGVGGGMNAAGGTVVIYDGELTATGGVGGAGIGGGRRGPGGPVYITGGVVTATGGGPGNLSYGAAGIGGGTEADGGSFTMTGGTVYAYGNGYAAAGVGGGYNGDLAGEVRISGGTLYAIGTFGSGNTCGDGIGRGGYSGDADANVIISGTAVVYAQGGLAAADANSQVAVAIRSKDAVSIYGGAMVYAGNEAFESVPLRGAAEHGAPGEYRTAKIMPCTHPGETYTITPAGHTGHCAYCYTAFHEEAHTPDGHNCCTVCGYQGPLPEFMKQSVVLSGQIGVNFFLNLPAIEGVDYSESYMTFAISGRGTVTARDDFDAGFMNTKNEYYGFTCYVNAIQMADTITATFHYGDGPTLEKTYSVREYLEKFSAEQDRFDAWTIAVLRSLADYGHYIQPFLSEANGWTIGTDYAEMDLHFAEDYDIEAVKSAVAGYAIQRTTSTDITKITYTLSMDSSTGIFVYFQPAEGFTGNIVFKVDGNEVTATRSGERYLVKVTGIPAHRLSTAYTVTAETENGVAKAVVSALSYVQGLLAAEIYQGNEDVQNAAASLYYYSKAADEYKQNQ